MRWVRVAGSAVLAAGMLGIQGLSAQEPPVGPPRDTTELVFEREVFNYSRASRRNPFLPVTEGDAGGPRFEELLLLGIIYSPNADQSVALLARGVAYNAEGELELEEGQGGVVVEGSGAQDQNGNGNGNGQRADTTQAGASGPGLEEAPSIPTTGYETYRLRRGEQIGNTRIVEIQQMRVIVEVDEFGLTETRELRLRTPGSQGGGQP